MASHNRIDSVIEVYRSAEPDREAYDKVYDERNELRVQNGQLWKIIEKQRIIIHQLQKIVNSNPEFKKKIKRESTGNKIPILTRKKDPTLDDNQNTLKEEIGNQIKNEEINQGKEKELDNSNKTLPVEESLVEKEYDRAQKTQSIIDEKYSSLKADELPNSYLGLKVSPESNINEAIDENNVNPNELVSNNNFKASLHKALSAPRLDLRKDANNSKNHHEVIKSNSGDNINTSLLSSQDIKSKLAIPPRSNLRNKNDIVTTTIEKEKRFLPTIAEKEEMLRPPTNKIPDLRKGKVNNKASESNAHLVGTSDESISSLESKKQNEARNQAIDKSIFNKAQRSLSESSAAPPSALLQKSILKNTQVGSSLSETNIKRHSKSTSLNSKFTNHRDSLFSASNKSLDEEVDTINETPINSGSNNEEEALEHNTNSTSEEDSNDSDNEGRQHPSLFIPSPPKVDPINYDKKSTKSSSSSYSSNHSNFDADVGFISHQPLIDEESHIAIRGSTINPLDQTFFVNDNIQMDIIELAEDEATKDNENEPILENIVHIDNKIEDLVTPTTPTVTIPNSIDESCALRSIENKENQTSTELINETSPVTNIQTQQDSANNIKRTRTSRSEEGFASFKADKELMKRLSDPKISSKVNSVQTKDSSLMSSNTSSIKEDVNKDVYSGDLMSSSIDHHAPLPNVPSPALERDIKENAILIQKQYKKIKIDVSREILNQHTNSPTLSLMVNGIPAHCNNDAQTSFIKVNKLEKTWDKILALNTKFKKELPPNLEEKMPSLPTQMDETFHNKIKEYFSQLLILDQDLPPLSVPGAIWTFLVSDVCTPSPPPPDENTEGCLLNRPIFKAGYLLKRGKKLGKLKLRFFVLNSIHLEYFESEDGQYLGTINLYKAQIAKSTVATLHSEQYAQYLYALTILEFKKGNIVKHIFFINNPKDWEEWAAVLTYYANHTELANNNSTTNLHELKHYKSQESLNSQTVQQKNRPTSPLSTFSGQSDTHINSNNNNVLSSSVPNQSEPSLMDKFTKKNKVLEFMESSIPAKKEIVPPQLEKKSAAKSTQRRTFHWNTKNFFADAFNKKISNQLKVFGVPLDQSILKGSIKPNLHLPAVIYRCVEYLEKHKAYLEEGIYRLSGSSADIQTLKEKFDHDGDYNLLKSSKRYDVHTIAGLLKLYLREMPTFILTNDLQSEFVKIIEMPERNDKVNELGRLVCALPIANYTTLRTLIAHLIRIVEKADINKMTLRNIGIVFVPTLAIPAGVFSLMILEFEHIFWVNEQGDAEPKLVNRDYTGSQLTHEIEGVQNPTAPIQIDDSPIARSKAKLEEGWRDNRNSILYRDLMPKEIVHNEHGLDIKNKTLDEMELIGEEIEASSIEEFNNTASDNNSIRDHSESEVENDIIDVQPIEEERVEESNHHES